MKYVNPLSEFVFFPYFSIFYLPLSVYVFISSFVYP